MINTSQRLVKKKVEEICLFAVKIAEAIYFSAIPCSFTNNSRKQLHFHPILVETLPHE
jgi:hypothetical protein